MAWRSFSARPSDECDYVIVGAGPSGLTAAVFLAQSGAKVFVVEGHPDGVPGGTIHTFSQGGADVCAGFHYIGCFSTLMRALWRQVTAVNGDDGQQFIEDRESPYDTLVYPDPRDGDRPKFIPLLPRKFEAIMKIKTAAFDRLNAVFNILVLVKMLWAPLAWCVWALYVLFGYRRDATSNYTAWCRKNVVPGTVVDDELEHVWSTNAGDHGMRRADTPAIMGAVIQRHYSKGTSYIVGGMPEMVRRMCTNIRDHGGAVLVNAVVTGLTFADGAGGRCNGVVVGGGSSGDGVTIKARKGVVISSTEALVKLLGKRVPADILNAYNACGPSVGHGCLFLTYKGLTPADLGLDHLKHGCLWIHMDPTTRKSSWEKGYFVSVKHFEEAGTTLCYILWEMPYVNRGADYEDAKVAAAEEAKRVVFSLLPKLAAAPIDTEDSSTPATTQKYLLTNSVGSSYGLAARACRFGDYSVVRALRPETACAGVWLTGQDVLCLGVNGALFSGALTANAILNGNSVFNFLSTKRNVINNMVAEYQKAKKAREGDKETKKTA